MNLNKDQESINNKFSYKNISFVTTLVALFVSSFVLTLLCKFSVYYVLKTKFENSLILIPKDIPKVSSFIESLWVNASNINTVLFGLLFLIVVIVIVSAVVNVICIWKEKTFKFNLICLIMFLLVFVLGNVFIYLSYESEFYYLICVLLQNFFLGLTYDYVFIDITLYTSVSFILLFLIYVSFLSIFQDKPFKKKILFNSVIIVFLVLGSVFIIISPNFFLHDLGLKANVEKMNTLEFKEDLPDKRSLIVTSEGNTIVSDVDKYSLLYKIPLSKHNFNEIDHYLRKSKIKYCPDFNDFILAYYSYNFKFDEIEDYLATSFLDNNSYIINLVYLSMIYQTKNKLNLALVRKIEKLYDSDKFRRSEETECFQALLNYKLGNLKKAGSLSKSKKDQYCVLTRKLIDKDIQNTTFKGQIVNGDNVAIAMMTVSDLKDVTYNVFSCLNIIDFTHTKENGTFSLDVETDQPIALVILNGTGQKVLFDYSKLKQYKQGIVVDLGKIVIE